LAISPVIILLEGSPFLILCSGVIRKLETETTATRDTTQIAPRLNKTKEKKTKNAKDERSI